MKKIVIALLATISGVVLLFSYRTSTEAIPPTSLAAGTGTEPSTSAGPRSSGTTPPASSAPGAGQSTAQPAPSAPPPVASTGLADGSYQGPSTSTRWGPVQVQITVGGGKVTDVQAIDYPTESGRDQQINSYAIPRLAKEALAAQSAKIDMVSGATVTSRGYITSLQGALDQAKG
ncbi:FMN-binding protein [Microbacterium sp. Gd 4-13]|uniref:FMN-binding protein n=1 Tax=Microbacterium sp. Gd 4-13 TaxID=2173179 RepID=UPI000D5851A9|nr:FMN-binding protein [Microbacterium sp. Gd 4-13]PVW02361.1 FMN-binding protein [Microbacterium sp. Gd 4-13]